ncbi:MAG: hypothetical protein H0T97_03200 [Actinobacteria bacterium]|nr:hypothetical protein [Actinomycetota bacterium]
MTRWSDDYVLVQDDAVDALWRERGGLELVRLYILGDGFDPRVPTALEHYLDVSPPGTTLMRFGLRPSPLPTDESESVAKNRAFVAQAAAAAGAVIEEVAYPAVEDAKSAGRVAMRELFRQRRFEGVDEIVVDVSGLPLDVYFAIVRDLLRGRADGHWSGDLFVVACENPQLDAAIVHEGSEDVAFLHGFAAPTHAEAGPRVWIPLLGEGRADEIRGVFEEVAPMEICPVLPSPSSNPRRSDDMILELRELLFEELRVDERNFIYASEWNPFDLFRSLQQLHGRYASSLKPLGPVAFTISAHSSKLLSLGALLAAYEHGFGVVHATPTGYYLRQGTDIAALRTGDRILCAWVDGTPYE